MLIKLSNATAALLKTQLHYEQWVWSNENSLDLASIKQLTGCRAELVQDCLKLIQTLDSLVERNFFNTDQEKNYAKATIESLIEGLKKYTASCERYPRLKNFLNIIPDDVSSMVGFTLIISSLIATLFPPLAVIPVVIFAWILTDLFFNNRDEAKNFKEIVYTAKDELRTIEEANNIFKTRIYNPSQTVTQTEESSLSLPGTSGYSVRFYNSIEDQGKTSSINSTTQIQPSFDR